MTPRLSGPAAAGLVAAALAFGVAARSYAYPQFPMSRDQTCTGCHISPAGGGLLTENGLLTDEAISQWGTPAGFFYGKIPTPPWLVLGGDLRGASGYVQTPEKLLASFPMQIEAYAHAACGGAGSCRCSVCASPSTRRTPASGAARRSTPRPTGWRSSTSAPGSRST